MSVLARLRRPDRQTLRTVALAPVVLAPHLLAGASAELTAVIALMFAGSAVLTLLSVEHAAVPSGARELTVLFGVLLALACVQAIPLPCGFVDTLLGTNRSDVPLAVARLTGSRPFCSVSVDPGLTATAIVHGASCLVAFLVCALHSAGGHRRDVLAAVALSGATIVLSALLHVAYDADTVYGVHTPTVPGTKPFGPIINLNQLAGFCALTMPTMVACALDRSDRRSALPYALAAAAAVGVGLATLSRGGITALMLDVALVLIVLRTKRQWSSGKALVTSVLLVSAGIATWFVLGDAILRELLGGGTEKISLILSGMEHAVRQGPLGHGRGAFGIAALEVSGGGDWLHYAESMPVQWTGDFGVIAGPVAVVALGARVLYVALTSDRVSRRLAAVGLVAFGLQNFVDFGIEVTGIAVVASAALAACVTEGGRHPSSPRRRWFGRACVIVPAILALVLAAGRASVSVDHDLSALRRALASGDFDTFDQTLGDALAVHPRNPALTLFAAAGARVRDADTTVAWLNISMRSAPAWWSPHREAALFFLQRRRHLQAAHEAKIVAQIHRGRGIELVCELGRRGMRPNVLARTAPEERPGAFLADVATCLPSDLGRALDARLLAWRTPPEATLVRAVEIAGANRNAGALAHLADKAGGARPRSARTALAFARAFSSVGDHAAALLALDRARALRGDASELAHTEATVFAASGDRARMRRSLEKLREAAPDLDALAQAEVVAARLERGSGSAAEAVRALERAYELDGRSEHLAEILTIAEAEGWEARTVVARRQLCAAEPTHAGCHARP